MSKTILLIDSDESFLRGMQGAISAHGFSAVTATDSDAGLTLARKESPDLIVVCVEAQPTNGYMLCTRLKKDDQLKSIPVILTSSSATPESFEKHKKLKTRAEEYLIKPFAPSLMLQKASELLGVPLDEGAGDHEQIVSMEDEPLGMGDLLSAEDEPISLTDDEAAEAREGLEVDGDDSVVVEEIEDVELQPEPGPSGGGQDDDLKMFDRAFDAIGMSGAEAQPVKPNGRGSLKFAGGSAAPVAAARRAPAGAARSAPAQEELVDSGTDDLALDSALSFDEETPAETLSFGGNAATLEARVRQLELELAQRTSELEAARKGTARSQQRADSLGAAAKKFERELAQARDELKSGGARGRLAELEKRVEELESEQSALTGEKELLAEEREELRQKLAEAQEAAARNEERAVKAYQKMKGDERLREKTRKALEVALQLLQNSTSADASAAEPEKQSA